MPVIVNEVVISVDVANQSAGGGSAAMPSGEDRQAIINECVERVLAILETKKER